MGPEEEVTANLDGERHEETDTGDDGDAMTEEPQTESAEPAEDQAVTSDEICADGNQPVVGGIEYFEASAVDRERYAAEHRANSISMMATALPISLDEARQAAGYPSGKLTKPDERAAIIDAWADLKVDLAAAIYDRVRDTGEDEE